MNETTPKNTTAKWNTKQMALVALMTAVTCILGPISLPLPFSPVPISLTNLAIFLSVYLLGMKRGILSTLLYLLIGLIGVPVFSSFSGGPGKLFGPTGGYLVSFLFVAAICGFFIEKWPRSIPLQFLGLVLGSLVCYLFGTVWLAYQANMSFSAALAAGVIPFIPGDLVKIIIAMAVGTQVRKRLAKAGLV